jgi:hypothetical protein
MIDQRAIDLLEVSPTQPEAPADHGGGNMMAALGHAIFDTSVLLWNCTIRYTCSPWPSRAIQSRNSAGHQSGMRGRKF